MQSTWAIAAFFAGALIGFLVAWTALQRRYSALSADLAQSETVRDLEKRLHQKDCDYLDQLAGIKRDMLAAQESQVREAVTEARDSQRAEFESQLKAFAVNVAPWVEIRDLSTVVYKRYRERSGYQYQLLVNGIPAFDPHITTLHDETRQSVDEEAVVRMATQAAQAVLDTYSGASQIFRMAAPVVRRLAGKGSDA